VQPSDETARESVARTIIEIERSCLDADAALGEHRWSDVNASFRAQEELTARLAALFEGAPATSPANDPKVAARVNGILAYREQQLQRLAAYRDEVGARLSAIGKVNAFSRSFGKQSAPAQLLDGQY
jgi:hypothetical protein